jgi:hypothetical protein
MKFYIENFYWQKVLIVVWYDHMSLKAFILLLNIH